MPRKRRVIKVPSLIKARIRQLEKKLMEELDAQAAADDETRDASRDSGTKESNEAGDSKPNEPKPPSKLIDFPKERIEEPTKLCAQMSYHDADTGRLVPIYFDILFDRTVPYCYIDPEFATRVNLPLRTLGFPVSVRTRTGAVHKLIGEADLPMTLDYEEDGVVSAKVSCLVVPDKEYHVVLGHSFLNELEGGGKAGRLY